MQTQQKIQISKPLKDFNKTEAQNYQKQKKLMF